MGDTFYRRSQRYRENPDYSPKHVGATWAVSDACDYVRPSAMQMNYNYMLTENSVPMYKAFNIYEDANMGYEDRVKMMEGPAQVDKDLQNPDIKNYHSSGGVGKHTHAEYKNAISSIQDRLTKAQQAKGNLTLNNMNTYGNSWKQPAIDMKFKQTHGGATAQRFYSKFPIYRERKEPPDVHESISDVWRQTIDLTP